MKTIFFFSSLQNKQLGSHAWKWGLAIYIIIYTINLMVYCSHLPHMVCASWLWRISRGTGANQKRRFFFGRIITVTCVVFVIVTKNYCVEGGVWRNFFPSKIVVTHGLPYSFLCLVRLRKVLWWSVAIFFDWLKKSCHLVGQSNVKVKPNSFLRSCFFPRFFPALWR